MVELLSIWNIVYRNKSLKKFWWIIQKPFYILLIFFCILFFPSAYLNIPPEQFKLVLDSVIWAFKHTMRNVADTGLDILYTLLQNVANHEEAAQSFYQTYFTDILQHVFSVVTDSSHTAGTYSHLVLVYGRQFII